MVISFLFLEIADSQNNAFFPKNPNPALPDGHFLLFQDMEKGAKKPPPDLIPSKNRSIFVR